MIIDTLSKVEVMSAIKSDFDKEIFPYYCSIRAKLYSLIRAKAQRERKVINLGWEKIESNNRIKFEILKRGDSETDLPLFVAYFRYKGQNCYAECLNGSLVVYTGHCLQRYAERVLEKNIPNIDVFKKIIIKNTNSSVKIVLSSPTHKICVYSAVASALMLGDYDEKIENNNWYNTCLSLKETHVTQSKILQTLSFLQCTTAKIGFNPAKSVEIIKINRYIKSVNQAQIAELIKYLKYYYMLYMLHKSFEFEITDRFDSEISIEMEYIRDQLAMLSVSTNELSPYDKLYGIAIRGELDYKY